LLKYLVQSASVALSHSLLITRLQRAAFKCVASGVLVCLTNIYESQLCPDLYYFV
jgi:hypothetical protein